MGEMADYYLERELDRMLNGPTGTPSDDFFHGVSYEAMEWETLEGKRLLICEMTRDHLINCKNMMEREGTDHCIQYQRICEELEGRTGAEDFR